MAIAFSCTGTEMTCTSSQGEEMQRGQDFRYCTRNMYQSNTALLHRFSPSADSCHLDVTWLFRECIL